jgi:galactoside O-acetyltransferase
MDNSIFSRDELLEIGFKKIGENVSISKKVSLYGVSRISIGDNVRIDDFCILTAGSKGIDIGSFVHIAGLCYISGGGYVKIEDFCGVSSRSALYSATDDYSGEFMTNPTIPEDYKNIYAAPIILRKHSLIGTGSTVLPGVELGEGASVGAMSLINKTLEPWCMYVGIPAKYIKPRKKDILQLEKQFLDEREK